MSSTCSAALVDSASDLNGPECEPWLSVKSTPSAAKSLPSTGQAFPVMQTLELFPELAESILSAEDSPASQCPLPGSAKARQMTATSGLQCLKSSSASGQLGSLERTLLDSSAWGSTKCWLTWQQKVTPAGHLLFQLVPLEPTTSETGSGLLPTLTARDYKSDSCTPEFRAKRDALATGKTLPWTLGGLLNPLWCEPFMGYPAGWTELEASATQSSRRSRKSSVAPS